MHELSLFADLMRKIEDLARRNGATRVIKVRVKLGALSHLSAPHFREHFADVAPRSVADGAELEIEELLDNTDPRAQDVILESIEVAD
ncbi:hydrogenase maturation nickel metallochaperone HypA [Candidatus Poribacteria bacterium]|nr:hydrogenase maturation nickel metallochaperone HypA [Candidatus Poribacteria bacterium]